MRLTSLERRALVALLEAATEGSQEPLVPERAVHYFEELLDYAHRETRLALRFLLFSVAYLPALWGEWRFWRLLPWLPWSERAAYAQAILHSRLYFRRQLFKGLCVALYFPHYGRTEAARRLGWDGPALNTHYQRSGG